MRLAKGFGFAFGLVSLCTLPGGPFSSQPPEESWSYREAQLLTVGIEQWGSEYTVATLPRFVPEIGLYRVVVSNTCNNYTRRAVAGWMVPSKRVEELKVGDELGSWYQVEVCNEVAEGLGINKDYRQPAITHQEIFWKIKE